MGILLYVQIDGEARKLLRFNREYFGEPISSSLRYVRDQRNAVTPDTHCRDYNQGSAGIHPLVLLRNQRTSASCTRSLWVARNNVFLIVPSVVFSIPATVRSLMPW